MFSSDASKLLLPGCWIPTLDTVLFENVNKYKLNDEAIKILLFFDFLKFFYGWTMKLKV